jgi:DNA-binding response OmpR family regulator
MATILIASVDGNLGYVLGKELEDEGHFVGRLPVGADLSAYLGEPAAYEVVVLDLLTSCLNDLGSLRAIKKACPRVHIIVFSDRVAPQERTALLTSGADTSFMKHEIKGLKEHLRQKFR